MIKYRVGAVFGHKWYVWDLNRLYGVTPTSSGDVSTWTGHCFKWVEYTPLALGADGRYRWSPVHRHLFAIASFDVGIEDTVKIYDTRFPHSA
ncbi:hypothetical protein DACRYDRAFT_20018 [Dacryopinax primogenitus]|uniref:Uncharacterized protein n=1 Tax=Dacryopinax primogenitus (strain DJM 731) TaxID=1858805 RepID=M5G9U1_DACPD|nr:uncharacterized protein DACRYDRAFT_20018 [Dacryopinax primogenitus]EJU05579.1 hypothetical protein DACRYDRAFT_20018 [Dacryopinax primogenitus]